jgi:transcriptional regulator with XRE-family HTH domain
MFGLRACNVGRQLRAIRILIGMEQIELVKKAKVSVGTIRRMESFEGEIGSRVGTLSLVTTKLRFLDHASGIWPRSGRFIPGIMTSSVAT